MNAPRRGFLAAVAGFVGSLSFGRATEANPQIDKTSNWSFERQPQMMAMEPIKVRVVKRVEWLPETMQLVFHDAEITLPPGTTMDMATFDELVENVKEVQGQIGAGG